MSEPDETHEGEQRVTPLELFFDLVFVFAVTQVTGFLAHEPTWPQFARSVLLVAALWWAWVAYSWLTNTLQSDGGLARVTVFAAMGAMLIASLAVPHAFGENAALFAVAYLIVKALHVATYWAASSGDPELRRAVRWLAPPILIGPLIILIGAAFDGVTQGIFWVVALLIDYTGPLWGGMTGWRVHAGHFAERHGLIIIIALGESIVALGLGAGAFEIDALLIFTAVLGVATSGALWWAYFDVVALVAERRLTKAPMRERVSMARDSYSYLHLPMVLGIILFSVGVKKALAGGSHLHAVGAVSLYGGVALYLLGLVGFRLRNVGTLNRQRTVAAGLLLACIPLGLVIPRVASLGVVCAISCGLIAYEALRFSEARDRVRSRGEIAVSGPRS